MTSADFILTYNGPALATHEMNVRDLAPAMLAVGEVFEALNALYNGKAAQVAVNVRALEPGCFSVAFDVFQAIKDGTSYLTGTDVTAAINLKSILFPGGGPTVGGGLFWLIRRLRGRAPRVQKLSPNLFRLEVDGETYDVPMQLLQAYNELSVRRAIARFVERPLNREGINEVRFASAGVVVERIAKDEAYLFRAPELPEDVVIDDTRRAAYTIRDLSFDADGRWTLNDGANPIKATIEDQRFLAQIDNNEIRFAKNDVLVCSVHFVQRRTAKGLANEYTVKEVLQYIPAPTQLNMLSGQDDEQAEPA